MLRGVAFFLKLWTILIYKTQNAVCMSTNSLLYGCHVLMLDATVVYICLVRIST